MTYIDEVVLKNRKYYDDDYEESYTCSVDCVLTNID